MQSAAQMRIIFRMVDNRALLARITERLKVVGLTKRGALISAGPPATEDSIRLLERGHPPRREVLRVLAVPLECTLEYLEEVAPDVRVDSRDDDDRREWVDLFDEIPPADRPKLLEMMRAYKRAGTGG